MSARIFKYNFRYNSSFTIHNVKRFLHFDFQRGGDNPTVWVENDPTCNASYICKIVTTGDSVPVGFFHVATALNPSEHVYLYGNYVGHLYVKRITEE